VGIPVGYSGRGTLLLYSSDNISFTPLGQLQQFEHGGSKQTLVDQTNVLTPVTVTQPLPVRVDAGEIDIVGLLNPQDPTYLAVEQFHTTQALPYWKARLVDGSSFTFQAYVSEFKAFTAKVNKLYTWTGKLRISGVLTPNLL
jgi:hypothetical protein